MERSLRPKTDKDFGAPPPGYIAGRGRGAAGFASGVSRNGPIKPEEEKEGDLGDANYDEFAGYSGSLFQRSGADKDDDEADRIYDLVDARMDSRRKKARDMQENRDMEKFKSEAPDLTSQFVDLKRDLGRMTEDDWSMLPDAQERLKAKKVKKDSVMNAPDSLLMGSAPALPPGMPSTSLTDIGQAKKAVLAVSLDREENAGISAGVDADNYLGQIGDSGPSMAAADIGEIKKARLLFKSVTRSDPTNPTGWIAASRLEEVAANPQEAKAIIARGLSHCPTSEDLWMSATRLELNRDKAKSIVANGIRKIPKSVKLWTEAANLEDLGSNKIKVFQKALELVPKSVDLWKNIINLTQNKADVLILLSRAVECCPAAEDLWLTYAKLSDYQAAQKILNEARRAIPTSVPIWIAAAELAESMGAQDSVLENICGKAIESLSKNGVTLSRREWLVSACKTARAATARTLTAVVVKQFIYSELGKGIDQKSVKQLVLLDFDFVKSVTEQPSCGIVAVSLLSTAVLGTPLAARKGLWIKLIYEYSRDEDPQKIIFTYQSAVSACPHSEVLWLMFAKYLWGERRDANAAREVLRKAADAIDDSEDIYIAALKIEERIDVESARSIVRAAVEKCGSSTRLWLKAAQLERGQRLTDSTLAICREGISKIAKSPDLYKLWLIGVHALVEAGRLPEARDLAGQACEACPTKPPVWCVASDIAVAQGDFSRARSILERGRVRAPSEENLWYKGYLVEELNTGKDSASAKVFLSRALQSCPSSGLLWACAIQAEPVATRHPKCLDALKRCQNDPLVVSAVAKFFWLEKLQLDKARKWFQNAVGIDPGFGQVWAEFLAFELSQGDENLFFIQEVVSQILALDERTTNKGLEWNQFRKQVDFWWTPLLGVIVGYMQSRYPDIVESVNAKHPKTAQLVSDALASAQNVKSE